MRKLIFILIVFLTSGICFAQDIKPTSNLVTLPTYSFSYHTSDSTVWMYKGSTYQWTKLFRTWYVKSAGNVIVPIHASDTLNMSAYKLVADSVLKEGYVTNWKLSHQIDSIMGLVKYRNDSIVNSGYFTNWKALQYRKLNNHDSLSSLDERSHASLTNILGAGSYHVSLSQRDSILSAEQHADTIRNAGHATIYMLRSVSPILTFSNGLTRTVNNVTNDLITGKSGGQTAIGGTGITDILTLKGTSGNGTLTSPAINLNVGNNGATNSMTILNNGNVGIGTTNPSYNLVIKNNNGNGNAGFAFDANNQNWGVTYGAGGNFGIYAELPGSATGGYLQMGGSARGDAMKDAIIFGADNAETMRIDGNAIGHTKGYVGIGTTAPAVKLDVWGAPGTIMNFRSTAGLLTDNMFAAFGNGRAQFGWDGTFGGANLSTSDATKPIVFSNSLTAGTGEVMRIINGNVGIGVTSPTAYLNIKAGTATAGTAPLKFTSGTLLTTPEAGAVEFDGTHYYGTVGSTRYQLDGGGTVTSVAMTTPTGLTVTGSPITSAGTLALGLSTGYVIPTTADTTRWTATTSAISGGTTSQYFRGDKTWQTLNTTVVPELTNLYYTNARVEADSVVSMNKTKRHNPVYLVGTSGLTLNTNQGLSLDTASSVVLSRQRAANTYQIKGSYQPAGTYLVPADSTSIRHYSNSLYKNKSDTINNSGYATNYKLGLKVNTSLIGANNGVASLDAGGKVPFTQLPASLMIYKGLWDPSTNTPTLSDLTGVAGWVYKCSANGTANTGSGSISYLVGDFAIHNGSVWQRSVGTDNVVSVNGQQGVVVLNTDNVNEGTTNKYYLDSRARASLSAGTGISYNSTTGVITNSATDQTVAITSGLGISATGTYPNFTVSVDTSNASILSRQRAANTYQTKLRGTLTGQMLFWNGSTWQPSASGLLNYTEPSGVADMTFDAGQTIGGQAVQSRFVGGNAGVQSYGASAWRSALDRSTGSSSYRRPDFSGIEGTYGYQMKLGRSAFMTDIVVGDGTVGSGVTGDSGTGLSNAFIQFPNYQEGTMILDSIGGHQGLIKSIAHGPSGSVWTSNGHGASPSWKTPTGIGLTSLSSTATGLTYTNTTGVFSLTSGYFIPTTATLSGTNTGDIVYISESFEIPTYGSTGSVITLSHAPKNATGVLLSQNSSELKYSTQYTVSGTTVTFSVPVYQYDKITVTYTY